jgi:hypothetical protein
MKTILENIDAKNTKRVTTTSVKLFRDYLAFKGESADFENFTCEKLDEQLGKFYVEASTTDGDMDKKSTMLSYRQ